MADINKAIKGLECCTGHDTAGFPRCEDCPYAEQSEGTCLTLFPMLNDALELLTNGEE